MSTCYIVGAGDFYGSFEKKHTDLVIAADGGYDTLLRLGISPDLIIGDMDSITTPATAERIVFPTKKDETDTHLAYLEGVRRGYTDFVILGGVGGRDDHTFANYSLLIYARKNGHTATLIGEKCDVFAIRNEKISICSEEYMHFSAFAYGGEAHGVTIRGLEYEADDITLTPDFPLAVSNRFIGKEASIEVTDGTLLLMLEKR